MSIFSSTWKAFFHPCSFFIPGSTATVPTTASDNNSTFDLNGHFLPDSFPEGVDPSQYALPVFLEEPKDTYTARGASATLTCRVAHALKAYFKIDDPKGVQLFDLCTKMLCWDPIHRITAQQALQHSVFRHRSK